MTKRLGLSALAAVAIIMFSAPATAAVKVYTDETAFDAAISGAVSYTPTSSAAFGTTSYAFGPVNESAPSLVTYTGDYGAGVRSLGAFLDPVVYTSTTNALGLVLGYFIGPQTATYMIDGVTGTITVPDNSATPNSTFIGFTDDKPISVSFTTDEAEFDTLRVVSGSVSAAPEPSAWALLVFGVAAMGTLIGRRRRGQIGHGAELAARG